uniref:PTHB1 N-terminal domain-containing protein n=1 Tax=Oncorhynchus mykiss TaxID=8022 RepID=A0A8K9WTQ1_ONCMY
MSLFKEFDQGCLCVRDVDNSGHGEKIVVGNYMGMLRVFSPHPLLEVQLRDPVIQVEVGKFFS